MGGRRLMDHGRSVLLDYCELDTNSTYLGVVTGRKKSLLKSCVHKIACRQVCRAFSWLTIYVGGPGWYSPSKWGRLNKHWSRPASSVLYGLCFNGLPSMGSDYINQRNPFLHEAAFSHDRRMVIACFVIAMESKVRQTHGTILEHLCDTAMASPDRAISVNKTKATVFDGVVLDVTHHVPHLVCNSG